MVTFLALLLVAYVPGALLFRLPVGDRPRRAALPADERLFWNITLSVAWSCGLAFLLSVIGIYHFSLLLWINGVASLLLAFGTRLRLRLQGAPWPDLGALPPAALVVLGLWLYFPPSEYVMGGKDPGTYMNQGIQLAQRGTIGVDDRVVASVPSQFRDLFFPSHLNPSYYSLRFMGFFIQDPNTGRVTGQFPHLYPASIAIGYGLNGLSGARQAVGAWTLLGLVAVYMLGRRLVGAIPAAAAAGLLAINVIVVWFAKYPNAEVVMLALLSAALLATARALIERDPFFAPVAGLLLGLLLFLRFDAVLGIGGVVGGLLLARLAGLRLRWTFWAALLPSLLFAAWYLTGPMRAYFAYPVVFTQSVGVSLIAGAAVAALLAWLWVLRRDSLCQRLTHAAPFAVAAAAVLFAVYAFFVRQQSGKTAEHDAMAFRTFAWYVSAPGLALAVFGAALTTVRRFWRDPTFFTTTAVFAGFFFYKIRIVPDHFWMTRRFLPVILPATTLMIAALAWWFVERDGLARWFARQADGGDTVPAPLWPRLAGAVPALAIVIAVGTGFWAASRPVLHHVEYAGLIPRLEKMAATFGDQDLVVVESRNASDAHVLALPLAYIYARQVLVLNTPRPDKVAFAAFLDWAREHYGEVYFLGGGGTDLLSRRIGVEAVASDRFQIPEYESARNAYPTGVRHKEFDYSIYRFVPARSGAGWFTLDVGIDDDLLVVRFHAKEKNPAGLTFRWTRDASYVSILGMQSDTRMLTLWMSDGGRPEQAGVAQVTVAIDDRTLGTVAIDHDVRPYSFPIPDDIVAAAAAREEPARLMIRANTWNPRAILGVPDPRDLGIVVDRVEAR